VKRALLLLTLAVACRERGVQRAADSALAPETLAAQQPAKDTQQASVDASRRTAIVEAARRVSPSVVSITVESRRTSTPQTPWDFFFLPQGQEQTVQSFGTGFVIKADGIILTNQHVVAGATKIVVTLAGGTDLPAKVLGEDPITDIAVVKVDRSDLPVVKAGTSTDLMIGEWVVALGNPFAYLLGNAEPTVTAGVVSATGRNILPSQDQAGMYLDMIQTDASINPGNSGGPLANALGEVVGVNSSIFSQGGGSIGLGFAIPIERALRVADEIVKNGEVRRAWLGLDVAGAESIREWKTQGGVLVKSVAPGSPADGAGFKVGDILTQANGRTLRNYLDWEAVKLDLHVGDAVTVTAREGTSIVNHTLTSGDLPTVTAEKVTVLKDIQLVTLTPQIQAEQGVGSDKGALIFRIADRAAQSTGLRKGDVIVAMNRRYIRSAAEVNEVIEALRPRQPVRLYFERDRQILYTDLVFK
jgi:serine protease Do